MRLPRRGTVRAAIAVVALFGSTLLGTAPAVAMPANPSRGFVYDCDDPDALQALECYSRNSPESGSISGTVRAEDSGGAGVAEVNVGVYDDNWQRVGSAVTDADGSFTIGKAPGNYYVRYGVGGAYQPEWSGNARTIATAEPVTVVAGQVTQGVDAVLDLPGAGHGGTAAVWGRVLDETTQAPLYVSVELWSEDGTLLIDQTWSDYGERRSGEFLFTTLPAGSYQLRLGAVNPNGYSDYVPEWYTGATTVTHPPPVDGCSGTCWGGHVVHLSSPTKPLTSIPRPYVDGDLTVGSTVRASYFDDLPYSTRVWEPAPVTLAYQWQRDGVDLPGATEGTYTLVEADAGHSVRVVVTASKDGYRTVTRTSGSTTKVLGAVLSPAPTPTISGTTMEGETLTVDPGEWGPEPVSLTYEWYRVGGSQVSSDGPTLRLYPGLGNSRLYVKVTARKPFYTTVSRVSAPTEPIVGVVLPRRPYISGVPDNDYRQPVVGTVLTASTGGWSPASAALEFQWNRSGQAIPGAVQGDYRVVAADAGHSLTVTVTGSSPGYISAQETSYPTNPVPGGVFAAAPHPKISGTRAVGNVISVDTGTWNPEPTHFTYEWFVDGETLMQYGPTYRIDSGFGGSRFSVRVTAHKFGFVDTTRTASTAKVFPKAPNPVISGTRAVGSTLTGKPGLWMWTYEASGPSFAYQWYRDGAAISGATKSTYKLTVWDAGKRITLRVTAKKTGYETTARTSSATAMITGGKFSATPTPKISGTTKVGATLTATAGTWSPTPTLKYSWKRNGKAITGATARTYKLTNSDAGARITVSVTGSRAGFPTTVKTSAATAMITGGQFSGGSVAISGTKKVGATLTANRGGFSPAPTAYAYQWYRNAVAIPGATSPTYRLTASDVGKRINVRVAAKRAGFDSRKLTSAGYEPITR
jgi:Carboxypeptidase regulatory-like domain